MVIWFVDLWNISVFCKAICLMEIAEISNITVQPALSGFLLSHARGKLLIMVELYYILSSYTEIVDRSCADKQLLPFLSFFFGG